MKATICDVCGNPINVKRVKLKYKASKYDRFVDPQIGYWWGWAKLDICPDCFERMIEYITNNKND